ncbi:MAG: hypothetical protein CMI18_01600 [Opitutaceae bacterium]|nr:hypothetical protein [Opitutaceae bacterium]
MQKGGVPIRNGGICDIIIPMVAQPDVILKNDIARAINLMALEKERDGVKSLSRHNRDHR